MDKNNKSNKNNIDYALNSKKVDDIIKKYNLNIPLKNNEKIWFKNINNVRRSNISYAMSKKEIEEYYKSKMSVHYFAQEYCQIKREDGTIGKMTLRDYQRDIIDLYTKNRFSILMASRQVGKCNDFNTNIIIDSGNIPIFELYYNTIKKERKLTLLENIKLLLYRLYNKLG